MEETEPSQQMVLGKVGICVQKMKLEPYVSLSTKSKLKQTKHLNTKTDTLHFPQYKISKIFELIGAGKNFLKISWIRNNSNDQEMDLY